MDEKGRSRRRFGIAIATVILVAVVFGVLWFFGFVPLGLFSPGDQPSDGLNGHTVQSGEELVLSLEDVGAGWHVVYEFPLRDTPGDRIDFIRELCTDSLCYVTVASVFESLVEAKSYYDREIALPSLLSGRETAHGDDSTYWWLWGSSHMLVRYRNVVWGIRTSCEGASPFGCRGPGIDWVANTLLSKVNLVAP